MFLKICTRLHVWRLNLIDIFYKGLPWGSAIKNPAATQETWVWSLSQEDPLEEGMATHSSILAWRIPWTEEHGGLPSLGSQSQKRLKQLSMHTYFTRRILIFESWYKKSLIRHHLCCVSRVLYPEFYFLWCSFTTENVLRQFLLWLERPCYISLIMHFVFLFSFFCIPPFPLFTSLQSI